MRKGQKLPSRYINGVAPMTRAERNARRKELDKDPFHRKMTYRTIARWKAAHRDEINAARRAAYAALSPEQKDELRRKAREYLKAHPKKRKASRKRWVKAHKEHLKAYQKAYYARKKAEKKGQVNEC